MAKACNGISGRDHASCAGLKSSVLVSPVTLNTVTVILSGTSGLDVYHSAFAHDSSTDCAAALASGEEDDELYTSTTSWKASKTSNVCFNCSAAESRRDASVEL